MAKKKQQRHASALKAHRQSLKRNLRNRAAKKTMREAARAVMDAASAKQADQVGGLSATAYAAYDKAAQGGAIHWKTAARRKSRLARRAAAQLAVPAKA